jgi:hypothetical protein
MLKLINRHPVFSLLSFLMEEMLAYEIIMLCVPVLTSDPVD